MEFHEDGECVETHGGFCLFSLWIFSQIKRFAEESTLQNTNLQLSS